MDLPYFKFYPSDFMGSAKVQAMSPSEVGIYIKLLCHTWREGPLPDDPMKLFRAAGATPDEMRRAWPVIRRCFEEDADGRLVNRRLEKERVDAVKRYKLARKAADARWEKEKNADADADAYADADALDHADAYANPELRTQSTEVQNTETQNPPPARWMHKTWHEVFGHDSHPLDLTPNRRTKYQAMYSEQLKGTPDPEAAWRAVLYAVTKSSHHMSKRSYQMPESILRNADRRSRWVQEAIDVLERGPTEADRKLRQKQDEVLDFLRNGRAA